MLSVDQVLQTILAQAQAVNEIEQCSLIEASGRVLASDQLAAIDVPPADNSAMDGYAVHTDSLQADQATTLTISQTIAAGAIAEPLATGSAARIFTGAEVPAGANTVVMQEHCEQHDSPAGPTVTLPAHVEADNNIRRQGQDIEKGRCVVKQGQRLQAQHCGLLASVGIASVPVYRRCRVALLATGNELVTPGEPLAKGQIYNSNRYFLYHFLNELGCEVVDLGVVKDDYEATRQALLQAADSDCIISTGGVSVGEEDHIKRALESVGELNLWRIALKPGKPLAFGRVSNTPFFGLPGNPVSSFLTYCLFVLPFLKLRQGESYKAPQALRYRADFKQKANPKRQEYVRVSICHSSARVRAFGNQSSGVLSSITGSDGFAIVPVNTPVVEGDTLEVIPFCHFFN